MNKKPLMVGETIIKKFILTIGLVSVISLIDVVSMATAQEASPSAAPNQQKIDAIFARVNNGIITQTEFNDALRDAISELNARKIELPSEEVIRRQVANNLINERLQLQVADRLGITASESEIDDAIAQIARLNNMSVGQLMDVIRGQNISNSRFRNRMEKQIRVRKLAQTQFYNSVRVSDQEIDNFIKLQNKEKFIYDFRLLDLSIPFTDNESKATALSNAKEALAKAQAGEEFKSLVAQYSVSNTAFSGGDLGFVNGSQLPPAFFDALQNTNEGEVTSIIEDNGAYHILKLLEIRSPYDKTNQTLNEYRFSQLVLSPSDMATGNPLPDEIMQIEIDKVVAQIQQGESFEKLVRIYSADENTKSKNGDLGWIAETSFDDLMNELVNSLEVGEISQPIPIAGRYHIFKITDFRESTDFTDLERAEAEDILRRQKADEEYALWIQRLRKDSTIEFTN